MRILLFHQVNNWTLPISTYVWPPDEILFILMDGFPSIRVRPIYTGQDPKSSGTGQRWGLNYIGHTETFSTYLGFLVWSGGTLALFPYSVSTNTWWLYCSRHYIWMFDLIHSKLFAIVRSPYLHHIWNGFAIRMTSSCGNKIVQIILFQYPYHHQ